MTISLGDKELEDRVILELLTDDDDDIIMTHSAYPPSELTRKKAKTWSLDYAVNMRYHGKMLKSFTDANGTRHIFRGDQ